MKNKDNILFYFKTAAVLTIIASLTALMLAFVNEFTADRIAENLRTETNNAISELFAEGKSFEKLDTDFSLPITDIWRVIDTDGQDLGYCLFVTVKGFKEEISFVVGSDLAGQCIGIKILSSAETQGLGSRINETDYISQYLGKVTGLTLNNEIDAIAGATISSRALLEGVNAALAADIFKEENTAETTQEETAGSEESNETEGGISDGQTTDQP